MCVFLCFSIFLIASPSLSPLGHHGPSHTSQRLPLEPEVTQEKDSVLSGTFRTRRLNAFLSQQQGTRPRGGVNAVSIAGNTKGSWNKVTWVPFLSPLAKPLTSPPSMLGTHLESKLQAVPVHTMALPLGSLQTPIGSALAVSCAGSGTTPKRRKKNRWSGSTGEQDPSISVRYLYLNVHHRPLSPCLSSVYLRIFHSFVSLIPDVSECFVWATR